MINKTLVAPSLPTSDEAELREFREQTRALYDMKEGELAAGRYDQLVDRFYAADSIAFGPDAKIIAGRAANKVNYEHFLQAFSGARIESVRQFVRNGVGWDWTNFTVDGKDGKTYHAPMLFLWVKVGDDWISAGDVFAISPEGPVAWNQ